MINMSEVASPLKAKLFMSHNNADREKDGI